MDDYPDEISPEVLEQMRVSKMLSLGFTFSLVWLAGAGSLISFIIGVRGLIIIRNSRYHTTGAIMAWWCILAGLAGMLILPWIMISKYLR